MPKYLFQASYTAEGAKGLLKEGGSQRRATIEQTCKNLGGRLEAFYYAFGETDAFVIVDLPDHASTAAASLAVCASGAASVRTVVLMSPEEMDQAAKKTVSYRPPGH
jgi:uncharacterized protein with GYD domain